MTALSTDFNHGILDSAPDAMLVVDARGYVVFANHQVTELFGYPAAELVGHRIEVLIPQRYHARHAEHRQRYGAGMRVRPMGTGLDLFARRRDGSEFPVEISLSPLGGRGLVVAAIRDVTDRKRVEAELIAARQAADQANQAKSRFLAAASHDLRQPLQTLAMLNGTLRRLSGDPQVADVVAHQGQAIAAMSRLLNSLLDISKLESGAIKAEVTDFRVAALFEELREEFAGLAASKGLELRIEQCGDSVRSDPSLVGQILKNLVSNAIKYTREGWVQLRCLHDQSCISIEVLDTGIGIPRDQLRHIFDEFYQVGVSPNTTRDGYGLGLSIVDRLARLIDARVDVESEPGKGSRFALALPPGSRPVGAAPGHGADSAAGAGPRRARVLLVEDDAGVRLATQMLLRAEGYAVSAAASLDEALAQARQAMPDLLVTDYHLAGGTTGVQVIAALGELAGTRLPAVVITGDTSSAARDLQLHGGLRVVSKPVDAEALMRVLGELLRGPG
jgi:two-component system, sensor histidine kinase